MCDLTEAFKPTVIVKVVANGHFPKLGLMTLLLRNINRSPGLKTSMIKNVENVVYCISQKFTIFIRTLKFLLFFQLIHFTIYVPSTFRGILCVCTQYLLELIPGNNISCTI